MIITRLTGYGDFKDSLGSKKLHRSWNGTIRLCQPIIGKGKVPQGSEVIKR
jgi:hypothetical protein